MPSCAFSGESAKLDAEQRQREAEEDAREDFDEGPYSNRIANHAARERSTSSTQLAIQSVYSSEARDQVSLFILSSSIECY